MGHWADRDVNGPDELAAIIGETRAMFTELSFTLEVGPHVEGDRVAGRWTGRGQTQDGPMSFFGNDILRVRDPTERATDPAMRAQITAITNRAEGFHHYADRLMIGGKILGHNDPDHQERIVKFNELLANCAVYSTALDITDVTNQLAAEGHQVDTDDLATVTPYIQHTIRRMGDLVLNLARPETNPTTRLDLQPRALFPSASAP